MGKNPAVSVVEKIRIHMSDHLVKLPVNIVMDSDSSLLRGKTYEFSHNKLPSAPTKRI